MVRKNPFLLICCAALLSCGSAGPLFAQQAAGQPIRVTVDMVQLNVAVTDKKGRYVTGLRPQDFRVTEDNIPEKIATFEEGNGPTQSLTAPPQSSAAPQDPVSTQRVSGAQLSSLAGGANVFLLFDTSNYMYRGFVFAQDAISNFVQSLQSADKIAFYSYSRDLSRAALLTSNREQVLRGVRSTVAGDDAALYNCLLLTVMDAAKLPGRKIGVVFSNGPDDASVVPPEDVAELAESTGTAIYMISTEQAQLEPISTAVFQRMSADTGGKAYFARSWRDEKLAFASIRDDLSHLYSLSYYPQPNPNLGWRKITVQLVPSSMKKYRIRTRDGNRLQTSRFSTASYTSPPSSDPQ